MSGPDPFADIVPPNRSEAMFNGAFHSAVIGMALVGLDGRLIRVNPSFADMLGYPAGELEGQRFQAVTHPDDLAADTEQFEAVLRGDIDHYRLEKRYLRKDGKVAHGMLSVSVVRDAGGHAELFVSQIEDIGARKLAERAAREEAERLALAFEVMEGGPWQYDIAGGVFTMSSYLTRFVCGDGHGGIDADDFQARIHPDDRPAASFMALLANETDRAVAHFRIRVHDDEYRWVRSTAKLLRDGAGQPESIVGITIDINEERSRQARLQMEAESDPLTGLLNRRGFDRRAAAGWGGLVLIDLDHFKAVNDGHGHAVGDAVLCEAARRIRATVRAGDIVARLGGDEFAVLLVEDEGGDHAALAERLLAALQAPYLVDGARIAASASIGVAPRNYGGEAAAGLLVRADAALYEAKRGGRAGWRIAA
ncbi:diguanylate cyclase [Edaphosphingomonas haloaromaticamans]|uniref:Putative diguanylate cyclase YegE n=1 Tax=Edaphosphingomonas haloaromaticamans TaxID=653954 RepID=A0A1S1HE19_9SPHN|nr:diguanylate cyclase [Sphingomonas haloaromaticamans]OHT19771.1 putative diguanylate cyclase YegE [Sphingomonas haloaromaticamans]